MIKNNQLIVENVYNNHSVMLQRLTIAYCCCCSPWFLSKSRFSSYHVSYVEKQFLSLTGNLTL